MSDEDIAPQLDWEHISRICDARVRDEIPPGALLDALGASASRSSQNLMQHRTRNGRRPTMLSKAEREVVTCLAHGMTRQEAADARDRSIQTVMSQIASAKRKLSAKTVPQLVYKALKAGLID